MSTDDFERKLSRQELRSIPPEWRADILQAAAAARGPAPGAVRTPGFLCALFWPSPKAWAGLAALWIVILGFHFATPGEPLVVVKKGAPSLPQLQLAFREQDRLLAELNGSTEPRDADRPNPPWPRPSTLGRPATGFDFLP